MSTIPGASRLLGKTVLITGASSGIGRSTAFEFARASPQGLKLVLAARRVETLRSIANEIKKEVGEKIKVFPVQLDVSNSEEVKQLVPALPEDFRDIDILVNNAGLVKGVAQAPSIAEEDIDTMFSTNVTGLINMTQAVLPIFQGRPDGGSGDIINVGSIAGREAYAGGSIYCATKAAVRSFTDSLRKELISTRIRVIEVDPGQVETEFSVVRFYGDKAKADAVYAGCEPLTPDDIAEVIVFAASRRQNVVIADTLIFPNHQQARPESHGPSDKEKRYDRQLRLWAASGQDALEAAHIVLINSGSGTVGIEALKNLVLPGIGRFTIIDDAVVSEQDLGVNFFLDESCMGLSRAECCAERLLELNPEVEGDWFPKSKPRPMLAANGSKKVCLAGVDENPVNLASVLGSCSAITLVLYTLPIRKEDLAVIEAYGVAHNAPVVSVHSAGFYSYFQIALPDVLPIVDTHPDETATMDLRLVQPWDELSELCSSLTKDINDLDSHEHGHLPFVAILVHYLGAWKEEHGGHFPSTYPEKVAFRKMVSNAMRKDNPEGGEENFEEAVAAVLKAVSKSELSPSLREVFEFDRSGTTTANGSFWAIADGVKEFYNKHSQLPVPGSLPDMKAKSDVYIQLQNVYKAKARADAAEVLDLARLHNGSVTLDEVELFCKNAAFVRLAGGKSGDPARIQKVAALEFSNDEVAEQASLPLSLIPIYLALHATSHKTAASEDEIVASIEGIIPAAAGRDSIRLAAKEVYRAGGGELHNISAATGGMVAQEIIKIVTKQYVPVDNTYDVTVNSPAVSAYRVVLLNGVFMTSTVSATLENLSQSLEECRSVIRRLVPGYDPQELVSLSRQELVKLVDRPTVDAAPAALPSPPLNTSTVSEIDSPGLANLEQIPTRDSEWDEERRERDPIPVESDDVNALSLSVDRQTSYMGASSIKAALMVMLKVQPGLKAALAAPLSNTEVANNPPAIRQKITPPKDTQRIPWSWKGQTLIDAYFKRIHVFVPMLDEAAFRADYLNGQRFDAPWLAVLNMVFAMGSVVALKSNDLTHVNYYNRAMEHLSMDAFGSSHLETVQALALIGGYYLHYTNRPNMANAVLGATIRMASALGLHRESLAQGNSDLPRAEARRRTWWSLFCLDTWATTTMGRPSFGRFGQAINIQPPEFGINQQQDSAQHAGILPLVENIKFCKIATQIQDMLAVSPLLPSEDRCGLDNQLISWHNGLPWLLRTTDPCAEPLYIARCIMKWRYQNLRMLLHRPVLLTLASNGASSPISEQDLAAVETCRDLARQTIEDISKEWSRNQMSGWNGVWFLYQAAMIPLVSIFWQWNSPNAHEWQKQIETILELLDVMEDWSLAARRSREVVSRMYEASRQPSLASNGSQLPHCAAEHGHLASNGDIRMSPIGLEPDGMAMMNIFDQHGLWDLDGMYWGQDGDGGEFATFGMNQAPVSVEYDQLPAHPPTVDASYFLR
ncbi:related to lactose regulatory protein [Cephalotrichum gorgonifer]|uniref:Related to lactose regulatory protein n=1 Tax=Cephalotrichum gorgonifer TaxID=2041049 RepID=A0AAE8N0M3_9PEZI|nr:related to lactose regulatory protein [Cephalotrichum gorgonifer]